MFSVNRKTIIRDCLNRSNTLRQYSTVLCFYFCQHIQLDWGAPFLSCLFFKLSAYVCAGKLWELLSIPDSLLWCRGFRLSYDSSWMLSEISEVRQKRVQASRMAERCSEQNLPGYSHWTKITSDRIAHWHRTFFLKCVREGTAKNIDVDLAATLAWYVQKHDHTQLYLAAGTGNSYKSKSQSELVIADINMSY